MALSTPETPPKGNNQFSYKLDKTSVQVWRRVFLIRYFNHLGKDDKCNIIWKDFDPKNRHLVVSDEKHPFEWRLPSNLFKSTIDVTINNEKLCVISIFYSKYTLLIQGKNCSKWNTHEYDTLKNLVSTLTKSKGSNSASEIDRLIKKVKFHKEIYVQGEVLDDSDLSDSLLIEATKVNDVAPSSPVVTSEIPKNQKISENYDEKVVDKDNKSSNNDTNKEKNMKVEIQIDKMLHEMRSIKETMHTMELQIVEKCKIIDETKVICQSLVEKCEKIPEVRKEIAEMREALTKITQSEIRENRKQIRVVENLTNEVKENVSKVKDEMSNVKQQNITPKEDVPPKKDHPITKTLSNKVEKDDGVIQVNADIESKVNADLWIIGSSIVKNLDGRKIYNNKITRISTLQDKTILGATEFIKMKKVNCGKIMYQIGSNDLDNTDSDVSDIIEEYENLIEVTRKEYPTATIFVGEVLPRFFDSEEHTRNYDIKRRQFNLLLEDLCKDKNLHLIKHENMRESDFYDGIHMNNKGVKFFVRNFKHITNPHLNVITPTNQINRDNQNSPPRSQHGGRSEHNIPRYQNNQSSRYSYVHHTPSYPSHNKQYEPYPSYMYNKQSQPYSSYNKPAPSYNSQPSPNYNQQSDQQYPRRREATLGLEGGGYNPQFNNGYMSEYQNRNSQSNSASRGQHKNNENLYQLLEMILRNQNY